MEHTPHHQASKRDRDHLNVSSVTAVPRSARKGTAFGPKMELRMKKEKKPINSLFRGGAVSAFGVRLFIQEDGALKKLQKMQ